MEDMAAAVAVDPEGAVEAGATQGAEEVVVLAEPAEAGRHPDRGEEAEVGDDRGEGALDRVVVVVVDRRRVRRPAGLRD